MSATTLYRRGFTLVSAIFLLVVITALGVYAVRISTSQQQTSALDVLGARAYQAARGGIEWGVYQVLQGQAFGSSCKTAAPTQTLTLPGTLSAYTVTVSCSSASATEDDNTIRVYTLTSTAKQGQAETTSYVERQITVTLWQ